MPETGEIKENTAIIKDWVDRYSDYLFSWALHRTSSRETAEDLVQETFLAAINSFSKFGQKSSPRTWLTGILNNKIADYHREGIRRPIADENLFIDKLFDENDAWKAEEKPQPWSVESENILDDDDFSKILEYCMDLLPGSWFSAIQLKYLEEKNGDLICQELDISPTNFWQILHRAKLQLRKCLEVNWFKRTGS